ncbi:MAG: acetyl-CoA carboxylase biotin carboxylase subunit [Chloroflexi bacterium]|nr:acetyl-CoA carboxylase biotin carboxylase subunit [Chloroflexota bacterium]MBU1747913.1 acetyl-CoA carboxylase biotin carboxylase subunit [Chloroflexota bacterium]MBU1880083.1 acetyl-CoA carboxylase biotin carboxylase subunit [Chloroflexota bacterium]
MFQKILVANRGEIAVRVLRACRELGLQTVAVYSDVDRHSLHVRYADEAYCIGTAPPRDSYLRADRIIDVARRSGAEAIHPGYGFLAENAEFAQACIDAGVAFVGPTPGAIQRMGDKTWARQTMIAAGVPVVPGTREPLTDSQASAEAEHIGYPVLIKAAAGGGGKGMRRVDQPADLSNALRAARSEAQTAFGDDTIYLEKAIEGARHIEFQVLADNYGHVVHLGERECSIQRRHQKLIEESPSRAIDADLRQRMGDMAVRAVRAGEYTSVGTVEFLLDRDKSFYFLEMNTRLQVEHPVTELVTGIDLVREQLRLAAGRRLPYRQEDIEVKGWAIECRICAEDPYNNFMPSIGRITDVYEPSGQGIRVDSGVFAGFEVSIYYDPLIAKLLAWGETRGEAILRMKRALSEYKILGIKTTIPLFQQLMNSFSFIGGQFDIDFMESDFALRGEGQGQHADVAALAAAAYAYRRRRTALMQGLAQRRTQSSPWRSAGRPGRWTR